MLTRRQLLVRGVAGGAGLAIGSRITPALGANLTVPPFVDALRIPQPLAPYAQDAAGNATAFRVGLKRIQQQLHSRLPGPADLWAYGRWDGATGVTGASYPGPTMVVRKGVPVQVAYYNGIQGPPLFPETDPLILHHLMEANPGMSIPPVRMNTHLHGGHISAGADGNPFHTPLAGEYRPGQTQVVTYANDQDAALAWYHDHAVGITRSNVMTGLAGGYVITDPGDGASNLPSGAHDIPLIIQDRQIDPATGKLVYPGPGVPDGRTWIPEFFGDVVLVNGGVWPYLRVDATKYRFRILNGSNARFFNLRFFPPGQGALTVHQIGTDLGYLAAPARARDVLLAPAERADVVVDFARFRGMAVELRAMSLPAGTVSPATPLQRAGIMQFRVEGPRSVRPLPTLPAPKTRPAKTRTITRTLEEVMDPANGAPMMALLDGKLFHDPLNDEDRIANGTTVEWAVVNLTADTHPIHLHLVDFEVVSRQKVDVRRYTNALNALRRDFDPMTREGYRGWMDDPLPSPGPYLMGKAAGPPATERGPKDTVRANPGEVTRIKATFRVPAGTPKPAKYVWHCHILEHEDNDMMRPYEVV